MSAYADMWIVPPWSEPYVRDGVRTLDAVAAGEPLLSGGFAFDATIRWKWANPAWAPEANRERLGFVWQVM